MYKNINNNIAIEYDPDIASKIKELIKEGFDKLKCFVKLKTNEIGKFLILVSMMN